MYSNKNHKVNCLLVQNYMVLFVDETFKHRDLKILIRFHVSSKFTSNGNALKRTCERYFCSDVLKHETIETLQRFHDLHMWVVFPFRYSNRLSTSVTRQQHDQVIFVIRRLDRNFQFIFFLLVSLLQQPAPKQ